MILEGLVTTLDDSGAVHMAPMGPRVSPDWKRFLLRPFPTSNTFRYLKSRRQGVLHVTDDVLLLAQGAIGKVPPVETFLAQSITGRVLSSACRYYEFVVREIDESQERMQVQVEVVHTGHLRDFFGLNRAMAAIVEMAILATRLHLIPRDEILQQFQALKIPIEKTGGPREEEAYRLLWNHVRGESP